MFCGDDTLVGVSLDDVLLVPLLCKRWSCPTCFPRRLNQLRRLAASGDPTTLITLTINPAHHDDPVSACKQLIRCWRLMRQRMQRDGYTDHIPFLAVVEATKRGWPHVHILARMPYVPQRYLSRLADTYIRSPIVDIRQVYNRRHASRYIAKYVSKGPGDYPGCKRYWRSQDYNLDAPRDRPIADTERRWFLERTDVDHLVSTFANCDWHHSLPDDHRVLLTPGPKAAWLWYDHDPPAAQEIAPCAHQL